MAATDYDFSVTRTKLLERAFRQIGVLALGETLTADQEAQGVMVLNSVVKEWAKSRTFLWAESTFTQALTAAIGTYTLPTDPRFVFVDLGYLRDSNNYDEPMTRFSMSEYRDITEKTDQGTPTHFACDGTSLYLYPIPLTSSTWTFYGTGVTKLKDWDTAGAVGDIPEEWKNALLYAVSADLSHEYGLPIGERNALKLEAEVRFRKARNATEDRGDSRCMTRGAF